MKYFKISLGIFCALAASRFIPHPPNFTSLLALSFYVPAASILAMIPAEVSLVMRGDLPLWRVRFEGLDESSARAACVKLYQTGNACFALPEIISKTSLL